MREKSCHLLQNIAAFLNYFSGYRGKFYFSILKKEKEVAPSIQHFSAYTLLEAPVLPD